ncbi:MAG: hypothetical protein KAI67_04500 [Candidatus Pacebacteria bacterium]|nr:hypothetical protein [Candidatus Paceibacterota bacterium]
MKHNNIRAGIIMLVILIASIGITSGELPDDRRVNVEDDDSYKNHNFSVVKQGFVYESHSPLVANEIALVTRYDNISVNIEDISRTKARTVLFNVSTGTEVVLVPISLDGRQVKTVAVNGTKVRIGLIELWRGQNCGFLKTEIMIVRPKIYTEEK